MRFETYIALRYLRGAQGRDEGRRFLRFITYVAIGGVAVGVAALLLALTIVRGFSSEIESKIVGFGSHVEVESFQDAPLGDATQIEKQLAGFDEVAHVAPVIQEFVLLRKSSRDIDGVVLWGANQVPEYLGEHLTAGKASLHISDGGRPPVVIGSRLAEMLGVTVGDRLTAFSVRRSDGDDVSGRPRVRQFQVGGIYETNLTNFDELYVFIGLDEARLFLEYGRDEVSRFDLQLTDVEHADSTAARIERVIGFPVMARTIYEVWQGLFAWVNLQESIIPLVISIIVIVAAFNIIGALLMITLEKTREIGVLSGMGTSPRMIRRLFLSLGLLIGLCGVIIGEALALGLSLVQLRYHIIPLPAEAYYMKWAPVELNILDFVMVAVVALILCALAAWIPARVASRIDPIRVIRFR